MTKTKLITNYQKRKIRKFVEETIEDFTRLDAAKFIHELEFQEEDERWENKSITEEQRKIIFQLMREIFFDYTKDEADEMIVCIAPDTVDYAMLKKYFEKTKKQSKWKEKWR